MGRRSPSLTLPCNQGRNEASQFETCKAPSANHDDESKNGSFQRGRNEVHPTYGAEGAVEVELQRNVGSHVLGEEAADQAGEVHKHGQHGDDHDAGEDSRNHQAPERVCRHGIDGVYLFRAPHVGKFRADARTPLVPR